jgi:hypothetical protein
VTANPKHPGRNSVKLGFSSKLGLAWRDELERIVFFNPDQARVRDAISTAVSRFGVPLIVEDGPSLRLSVPALGTIQSLFAFDELSTPTKLVGVVMFVRAPDDPSTMLILHLAVHEDYAPNGSHANKWVPSRLMSLVRDVARRTSGITSLEVLYPHGRRIELR